MLLHQDTCQMLIITTMHPKIEKISLPIQKCNNIHVVPGIISCLNNCSINNGTFTLYCFHLRDFFIFC